MLLHYTKTLICFGIQMIDFLIKIRKFSVSFLFFPFHPNLMVVKWMWFFTLFLSFAWGVHCTGTNNGY